MTEAHRYDPSPGFAVNAGKGWARWFAVLVLFALTARWGEARAAM